METGKFTYEIGILVDFTDDELTLLRDCCLGHYDGRVKEAADKGGFVDGWLNIRAFFRDALTTLAGDFPKGVKCSFDELDTCAKALEQPPVGEPQAEARLELRNAITVALRSLNSEWSSIDASSRQARLSESTANLDHCDKCDRGTRLLVTRRVCHTCNRGIEWHQPS